MNIEQVINLWNKSKYKTLCIKTLPVVNHIGEIVYGTGFYDKGQTILFGGEISVYSYLKQTYKNSLFLYEDTKDYIIFKQYYKVGDSDEKIRKNSNS